MMRHIFRLGCLLACLSAAPAIAQSTDISLDQAELLSFQLVANGQYDSAAALARTILEGNPDSQAAWLALSQAETGAGRTASGVRAAKSAWRNSTTATERYSSSIVAAQALARDGKRLQAQLWLRRAAQHAPRDDFKARAEQDFKYVRATNPLRANLRFSISPSSNINNGSANAQASFGGLSFLLDGEARALSGIVYQLGGDLSYTMLLSERQNLTFGVELDTYSYTLSSSAKALAPAASASNYAFQELRFTVGSKRKDADGDNYIQFGVTFGQNWYGGSPLTQFAGAHLSRTIAVGQRARLQFGASAERQRRQDSDLRSATVWQSFASYTLPLENSNTISIRAEISDTDSGSASVAHNAKRLDIGYRLGRPVFGKSYLELSLGAEKRDYDRVTILAPAPRSDTRLSASATMTFTDLDYFGFSPTATVSASRNSSNVSLYETRNLGVRFGLRSSF